MPHKPITYAFLNTLIVAALFTFCGCQEKREELPAFDAQRAFSEVEALVVFSPRDAGTPAGKEAAKHLLRRLEEFGIQAEMDTFTDQTPQGEKTMHNVIGRIPGKTDRWIILGSHFDTMPGVGGSFQGANDSGSSTGVLLELGRMMAGTQPEIGIILAFFDGEEGIAGYIPGDGLHGSRHMAQQFVQSGQHKKVDAMILMDMVGDPDLQLSVPKNSSPELVKKLFAATRTAGTREYFSLMESTMIDDHVPFLKIGIPALVMIDFHYGSAPGLNDRWHSPEDRMENLSAKSLEITGQTMLHLLQQMAFP